MGQDKATLLIHDKTLISHTYNIVRKVFSDIMIVSGQHQEMNGFEARMINDILPFRGSITGVASALLESNTPYVFVVGCDMPFLNEEAIRFMIEDLQEEDALVPKTQAGFEPLHSIYGRTCLSPILGAIEWGRMKLTDTYQYMRIRTFSPNSLFFTNDIPVFTNINTREDLLRAQMVL
jgi:molybdopterin-guanine dinucleotide biosynthesis protein A